MSGQLASQGVALPPGAQPAVADVILSGIGVKITSSPETLQVRRCDAVVGPYSLPGGQGGLPFAKDGNCSTAGAGVYLWVRSLLCMR
jgi:hypothetical protein